MSAIRFTTGIANSFCGFSASLQQAAGNVNCPVAKGARPFTYCLASRRRIAGKATPRGRVSDLLGSR
jgi:hypothetical protein